MVADQLQQALIFEPLPAPASAPAQQQQREQGGAGAGAGAEEGHSGSGGSGGGSGARSAKDDEDRAAELAGDTMAEVGWAGLHQQRAAFIISFVGRLLGMRGAPRPRHAYAYAKRCC